MNQHRRRVRWALWLGLSCAAPAVAQEAPPTDLSELDISQLADVDVVYAASKRLQPAREAPAALTVVTAADIRAHGYRTLAQVLSGLPGFYITDDRNYSYVGVRGFARPGDYSTRVLLLLDGVRLNDAIYDMAYVDAEFLVDLDLVDRIEVIRGPSAALYGNNAFFAVVNVVMRRGGDVMGAEFAARAGSLGEGGGRVTWGARGHAGEVLFSASASGSHGDRRIFFPELDSPLTNDGIAEDADAERVESTLLSLSRSGFNLSLGGVHRGKHVPTAPYATIFNDPRTRTQDDRMFVHAGWEHAWNRTTANVRLRYGQYDYDGFLPYEDGSLADDFGRGRWIGSEATVTTHARNHVLTGGFETQHDLRQAQGSTYASAPELDFSLANTSHQWGVFAQDAWVLSDALTLNLGLRLDQQAGYGYQLDPRAALLWSPRAHSTVKLLAGRAFRAPNAYERFYYPATPHGLDAEVIKTGEVVVEQSVGARMRLSASLFHNDIDGLVTLAGQDATLGFVNATAVNSDGLELSTEILGLGGLTGRGSYAYQHSRDAITRDAEPYNSPQHMLKLALAAPLRRDRFTAGAEGRWMSSRGTLAGARVPSILLVDLRLLARLSRRLEAGFTVDNAFDAAWGDPASKDQFEDVLPRRGRTVRIDLHFRLPRD